MRFAAADIARVLLAGAAGDCIGRPYEGRPAREAVEVPEDPWRITDDTALTLATCRGLVAARSVDPEAIAAAMLAEFRTGMVVGLGASTLKALRDLDAGVHWALAGRTGEHAAGNGAAMRIAPIAFVLDGSGADDRRAIRDVCRITHRNDDAYVAALAVVRALHRALDPAELPDTRVRDALLAVAALPDDAAPEAAAARVGTSGDSAASAPLALFLARRFRGDVAGAVRAAIACGGDTDTIASIAAQVCAADGGAVPAEWVSRIPVRDEIEHLAAELGELGARPRGGR